MGMPNRELDDGYRIDLFAEQDEVGEEAVVELWEREAALPPEIARRRIHEVLLVATHESGELVGVSSAYLQRNEQLAMDLWHYRAFVAGAHRKSNVAVSLGVIGRDHLGRRYAEGADRRGAGVIFEVENEGLKRYLDRATWRQTQATFIGVNHRGDHVRVYYFPGALAPEPPK